MVTQEYLIRIVRSKGFYSCVAQVCFEGIYAILFYAMMIYVMNMLMTYDLPQSS